VCEGRDQHLFYLQAHLTKTTPERSPLSRDHTRRIEDPKIQDDS
jgi:hypothetical protein